LLDAHFSLSNPSPSRRVAKASDDSPRRWRQTRSWLPASGSHRRKNYLHMFDIPDHKLPFYIIIAPLHREATLVAKLAVALARIDYPPEKLDIKLVLEEDDHETRAAAERLKLMAPFETIVVPPAHPRTKPKALASALPFARGSFGVVYDAEDEPEPDQLRKALAAFSSDPSRLACVQARLAIDNANDGWLCRHFAAEYAGQFDLFLPALARLRLPLPLGGTSNHFRMDALREVGGWDPFNVTEDADLGIRLARFGFRSGVIESATWEEAPVTLRQWLPQRTRWFKGWMHPGKGLNFVEKTITYRNGVRVSQRHRNITRTRDLVSQVVPRNPA
jgi:cellulose synthase/poly-beta-1,6-N-acetylglucosamine synthase-like glycosyltransferase